MITPGEYFFISTDKSGCQAVSNIISVNVNPLPSAPTVKLSGDTLISSAKTGNQWFKNKVLVKGATNQKYVAASNGNYSVTVTDSNGCSATSKPVNYTMTGINEVANHLSINIYPNPFTNQATIEATINENTPISIFIYDMTGRLVTTEDNISHPAGQLSYIFDAAKYGRNNSMFIVKISSGNDVVEQKIIRIKN